MRGGEVRAMTEAEPGVLPIEPGQVLAGKYRIEAQIGSGGMGVVLSARHVAMGSRMAIKVLRLDDDKNPQEAVARFVREARAAARIQSEHVVRVTDVAALPDGTPYMVMEYLDGEDLRQVIHVRRQLPIEEAVDYILQACEGLAEAHASGVIHRDLKPSNLFLARKASGQTLLKVLDFGISKVAPRAGELGITTTSSLMGSPLYMAPEQMVSAKNVDARVDIWSLGLILYELLTGAPPFDGETIPEICLAVMNAWPTAIGRFRKDVPHELQAILLRCMEKDREKRYGSMGELARALEPFAGGAARVHAERASAALRTRSVMVTEPDAEYGPLPRSTTSGQIGDTLPSWTGRSEKKGTRRRTAWIAVGAAACAVAATLGAEVARAPSGGARAPSHVASPPEVPSALASAPPSPTVSSLELASVPFDSLPIVAGDAGAPRAIRSTAHVATAATPTAPPPKAAKDDWKWGDRN
jgi:serine/threonine protein kinase